MAAERGSPLRLLSLDGGGIRGLSTLLIMKSIFELLEEKIGHKVRPCEIFDMISGTSTGGLIAVMLGPLRMDIQTCIDTYLEMAPTIFPIEGAISHSTLSRGLKMILGKERFDPKPLENFLQSTIIKYVGDRSDKGKDTPLRFEWDRAKGEPKCKVFLCVTSEKFTQHFRFRSYYVPGDITDCPIWQACRATSAAPTIFPPMVIGKLKIAYVDGGLGNNNPTKALLDEAGHLWHDKRDLGCVVSIGTGVPPMVDVGRNLKSLMETLAAMAIDTHNAAVEVETKMVDTYGPDQRVYHRFNVERGLENIRLEEWKEFGAITVATQAYIRDHRHRVEACVESLASPRPSPIPEAFPHLRPQYLVIENRLSEHFVGRTAELASLTRLFCDSKSPRRRAAIYGMPGMGKSQIMYQYVALYGKKYEAVFGADATTVSTIQSSYVDFFKALKLPDLDKSRDPDQRTRIAAVREWLRRRTEWLLIFDNLQEKDYNEWKNFLPGGDTGHILVTTRSEWAATTFTSGSESLCIHLDKLDPTSAPNLLLKAALLEKEKDGLMDLATIIVERLWYIPLTIEFVGRGNQSEEKLGSLLNVLDDRKLRESLEEKYSQDTGVLAYRNDPTTFLTLYTFEKLTPKTKEIWRVMAFMDPSWYSEYLFHTIRTGDGLPLGYLVSDPQELAAAFEELLGGGIIQRMEGQDGYWTHDLIHEISRVFLRTKDKESEYASFAASWLCAAFPEYRNFGKWDREKAYLKHAEVCVGFADELHLTHTGLQRLLYKASNFARFIGNYRTAERLARRGVDLFKDTDPEVRDVRDLFAAQDSLALALRRQSQYSEATYILEKNLEEETQMLGAKDKDTLNTLNEIGWGMFLAGDAEGAELVLREAMQKRVEVLTESAGPTQHTFQNLAACLTKLHKYKEAEELYKKAEAGHVKLFTEDHHWVQHIRSNIAQLYEADGRLGEAMDVYRGVYNWRRMNSNFGDDHPDTLRIAVNLARVYFKLDRREDAASLARRTRVRFERVFGNDHPETKELDILIWEIEKGGQA